MNVSKAYLLAAGPCIMVTALYLVLQPFSNLLYILSNTNTPVFSLVPVAVAFYGLSRYRGDKWLGRSEKWLLLGFAFWSLGEFAWSFYALYLQIPIPYPSIADAFWLTGYPFFLVGMAIFIWPFKSSIRKQTMLIAITVSAISTAFITIFLVLPVISSSSDIVEEVVGLAYPFMDIGLLFSSIMGFLLFRGGKIARAWYWMALGATLTALADILFSYTTSVNIYYDGHPLEVMYAYGYIAFGLALYERMKILW